MTEAKHSSMFCGPVDGCTCKWCHAKRENWCIEWPPEEGWEEGKDPNTKQDDLF